MTDARAMPKHDLALRDRLGLLFVIFIDGLGTALVLPLLPTLLSSNAQGSLVAGKDISASMLAVLYGVILASYAAAMVVGAPLLGNLSDRIGRRRALLLATAGTFAGYFVSSLALLAHSITFFILARLIGGVFAGSVPIAQAKLLDSPGQSMKSIGIVMFAITSGFMFGPVISGAALVIGSGGESISLDILVTPFVVAASLSALSLTLVFLLPCDAPEAKIAPTGLAASATAVFTGFAAKGPRAMLIALMFFQLGWTLFYQYLPWMMDSVFWSTRFITAIMALIGLGMCVAFCYLASALQKHLGEMRIATFATAGLAMLCLFFSVLLEGSAPVLLTVTFAGALLYGCGYTGIVAAAVTRENPAHVGRLLGTVAAVAALTAAVTALAGGFVAALGPFWLPVVSAGCFAAGWRILSRRYAETASSPGQ